METGRGCHESGKCNGRSISDEDEARRERICCSIFGNQYKPESEYFGEEYFGNETEQWLTYELNEGNSWRHTFQDLPKYDDSGNPWYYYALEIQIEDGQVNNSAYRQQTPASANYIRYVSESTSDENPDYTVITDITVSSGATVPASHLTVIRNIGYLDIGGTKTWDDQSDRHGLRPENIILTLKRGLRNGAAVEYEKVEGAEPEWDNKTDNSDQWFYTYRHLPAADYNGTPYAYTVEEAPVKIMMFLLLPMRSAAVWTLQTGLKASVFRSPRNGGSRILLVNRAA